MNEVIVRKANTEDFDSIIELMKDFALFQKTPEKVTITVEQMRSDEHLFYCLIAETKDKVIIGFALIFRFIFRGQARHCM